MAGPVVVAQEHEDATVNKMVVGSIPTRRNVIFNTGRTRTLCLLNSPESVKRKC